MASVLPPVKGASFSFETSLVSQADTDIFQAAPTLANGDVIVIKDGVLDGNIDSLPTAVTSCTNVITVTLSATEMNADRITVLFHDAAGDEWQDQLVTIYTVAQTLDTIDTNVDSILADTGTDGVLLAGTQGAVTWGAQTITSAAGDALTISSTGANGSGVVIAGNGSGAGIDIDGGATGIGVDIDAAANMAVTIHGNKDNRGALDVRNNVNGSYAYGIYAVGSEDYGAGLGLVGHYGLSAVGSGDAPSTGYGAYFQGAQSAVYPAWASEALALPLMACSFTQIQSVTSQTEFRLYADGYGSGVYAVYASGDDDAYNGWTAVIRNYSLAYQKQAAVVADYVGASHTVILEAAPGVFDIAQYDYVILIPPGTLSADAIGSSELAASAVAEIVDAVWDEILAGHLLAGSTGAKLNSLCCTLGSGAITFVYTLTSTADGSPIANADVWATTDAGGTNVVASGTTDMAGQVTFYLDAGTYYIWRQRDGFTFENPDTEVVS